MTQLNILDTSQTIKFSDEGADKLVKILERPVGRGYKLVITMSKSTYAYKKKILAIIGSEYEENIAVIADNKIDFGVIMVSKKDKNQFGQPEVGRDNVVLIRRIPGTVLSDQLDQYVAIHTPTYILMSQDTLNALAKVSTDRVDKYLETGRAFYHSYSKIPVALTNFLSLGVIDIVE